MQKSTLQIAFEDGGFDTRSYSGRGMFGKECLGIEFNCLEDAFGAVSQVSVDLFETFDRCPSDIQEMFSNVKSDSLGRGVILYFPDVHYGDEEPENELEEDGRSDCSTCCSYPCSKSD